MKKFLLVIANMLLTLVPVCHAQHASNGNPPIVPAWSLGHIVWEDSINTEQGVQSLYEGYVKHQIPVDGVIIDSPWSEAYNDFNWDRARYPHAEQMIKDFKQKNVKTILWLTGCVNTSGKDTPLQKAANYDEAERLGLGINGNKPSDWWKGRGLQIDFTNRKATKWWYTQLDKVFIDGVYGFKVDQGEVYFGKNVQTSVGEMSNQEFRAYYYDAMSDYVRMRTPMGVTIGRPYSHQGGYHSSTGKMLVGWCGDFGGDWKGLKLQIDNIYQSAKAGYGAVGCEVAGFMGARSNSEQLVRYTQFGSMTACMINGGENGAFSSHLAWWHGDDICDIYRYCVTLHNQLRPYLFSSMVDVHLNGGSLLKDVSIENESHKVGDDLFTKAITVSGGAATFRLPENGEWIDFFSGEKYDGGTLVSKTYSLDRFPIFIRKGAILPLDIDSDLTSFGNSSMRGRRVIVIYPKGKTHRQLYLPIGEGTDYVKCDVTYDESSHRFTLQCKKSFDYTVIVKGERDIIKNVSGKKIYIK